MSDKRAKVENMLRKERLSEVGDDISDLFHGHIEKERLFNRFTSQTSIETLARVVFLKSHKSAYSKLLNILRSVTANFSGDEVEIHHDTVEVIAELLRGDKNWNSFDVKQKQSILRDEDLVGIIDEDKSEVLSCILTNRVINHIKSGKITFKSAHQFRDMGALIGYQVIAAGRTKMKPIELTKSKEEKIKANLELLNKVGKLLKMHGEYGTIIASKEHIYVNGINIRAWLDDLGSVILTKVRGANLCIDDLCNSIETSHRSKRVLRIIERGVTRTKDYNVGVMFKASELLMCLVYIYNVIENKGILKKIGETPMNVRDIVLYAPV
jgi:hypothetical protein